MIYHGYVAEPAKWAIHYELHYSIILLHKQVDTAMLVGKIIVDILEN